MDKYFDNYKITFVNSAEEKLKYYKKADYIIEDYPYFNNKINKKIILIDTYYNKNVDPYMRVKTKRELEGILYWLSDESSIPTSWE